VNCFGCFIFSYSSEKRRGGGGVNLSQVCIFKERELERWSRTLFSCDTRSKNFEVEFFYKLSMGVKL
jgi:hypothetical protein